MSTDAKPNGLVVSPLAAARSGSRRVTRPLTCIGFRYRTLWHTGNNIELSYREAASRVERETSISSSNGIGT